MKVAIDKASTEDSKRIDSLIEGDNVDAKLAAAVELMGKNPSKAIQIYERVFIDISESKDHSIQAMEKRAYAAAQLANLTIDSHGASQTFYFYSKQALKFYQQFEADYIEEVVTLLNNTALKDERQKKYEEAINRYLEIIGIEDKYMSRNDERRLLTLNNLACVYSECGKTMEGSQLFARLRGQLKGQRISSQVRSLITQN